MPFFSFLCCSCLPISSDLPYARVNQYYLCSYQVINCATNFGTKITYLMLHLRNIWLKNPTAKVIIFSQVLVLPTPPPFSSHPPSCFPHIVFSSYFLSMPTYLMPLQHILRDRTWLVPSQKSMLYIIYKSIFLFHHNKLFY